MLMAFSLGNVWAAKDDVVYKYGGTALGTNNAYQNYDNASIASADAGSTVQTASWAATCGSNQSQKLWMGANNNQKAKMILSTGGYSEASAIASAIGVATSATYYAALIGRTNFNNVYKVTLEYSTPGGTAPNEAWILYSTDNGSTWTVGKKMTSLSTSGTNFELGETIESARYAFVIHSTNYCQFKVPILTFYEGSTSSCTNTVTRRRGCNYFCYHSGFGLRFR